MLYVIFKLVGPILQVSKQLIHKSAQHLTVSRQL